MNITSISTSHTPLRNFQSFGGNKRYTKQNSSPVVYKNNGVYYTQDSINYIQECIKSCEENINNPKRGSEVKSMYKRRKKSFEMFLEEVLKRGEVRVAPWGNTEDKENINNSKGIKNK